jgi:uncharacterized membrane protein
MVTMNTDLYSDNHKIMVLYSLLGLMYRIDAVSEEDFVNGYSILIRGRREFK